MTEAYLLDTNIVIAAMKGHPEVRTRLEAIQRVRLRLFTVVLGELEFSAEKSRYGDRNRARLAALTARLPLLPVDRETARHYGVIRAFLEAQGTLIGSNDTWIAAQALSAGAIVVTDNEREFCRVPGLRLENWLSRQPMARLV